LISPYPYSYSFFFKINDLSQQIQPWLATMFWGIGLKIPIQKMPKGSVKKY
jgi:hypothetical protein